ncbi:hypothetical protein MANES_16G007351v8 [Manihot esculenta]|uniref:Uncharacterized protein n=1 Tax=Manihot esculenta TaxID=3983 RepID=A0ACB7G4P8_MANES|nr:hypothetical protein MANES_16G007351v8 [Manihot esculenta]
MASSFSPVSIPLFIGENSQIWEAMVEEDRDPPPLESNPTVNQIRMHEEQATKKDKALTVLHTGVADHFFTSIMAFKTPKGIWDYLQTENEGNERVKSMKDTKTIKEYTTRVLEVLNRMRLAGAEVEQSSQTPCSRAASMHQNSKKKLRYSNNQIHKHQQKGNYPPCSHCHKSNHHETKCWKLFKCSNCNRIGHISKFCREKVQRQQELTHQQVKLSDDKQQALVADENTSEEHLYMAQANISSTGKEWLLDSGCSNHMTADSSIFCNVNPTFKITMRLGNGSILKATGKGTIQVPLEVGDKYIHDVLLVPRLDQNLLRGLTVIFSWSYQ